MTANRIASAVGVALAFSLAAGASAQELPSTMTWSSYDVGSAGYAEASAMADAFGKKYGTRVRIQPSGSSIGRLQPVVSKRADYGFLATEAFFSAEGTYDFGTKQWGPQNLRAIAGRPSAFGMPTAADAGIQSIADAKGKRVAFVAGNPSVNVKCEAILAFGGLTPDDVDAIMFPTYGNAMSALAEGKADATCTTTTPSQMYELAESPRGIHWADIPADDAEGWARVAKVAPFFKPFEETVGAGISAEDPAHLLAYRYPVIVTTADKSADEVYAMTKAMDETFDLYKDATAVMKRWALEDAGTPPADVPFHEGAVRYLKEKGVWTDEMDAWNAARLARLEALMAAWETAMADGADMGEEEFAELWQTRRQEALASLD